MNWQVFCVLLLFVTINVNCETELAEPTVTMIGCPNFGNIKTCTAGNIVTIITEFKMRKKSWQFVVAVDIFLKI
jgi:hypothetical protein